MKTIAAIAVCILLSPTYQQLSFAEEQPQPGSAAGAQASVAPADDLHFVNVLTFRGEVVSADPAKLLITLKRPNGITSTFETRSQKDLDAFKTGNRVVARYVEGAQIQTRKAGKEVSSVKDGMIMAEPSGKNRAVIAWVAALDPVDQEVTVKGSDGSIETIMVMNSDKVYLKVGDEVVITHAHALVLSLEKEN
ncbi:MAG TPA: hypothetical protein VEF07_05115 [Candidatus Binataceae bacterium]|nr:hypothetical protein [Candidatus Binataceae bacterium]